VQRRVRGLWRAALLLAAGCSVGTGLTQSRATLKGMPCSEGERVGARGAAAPRLRRRRRHAGAAGHPRHGRRPTRRAATTTSPTRRRRSTPRPSRSRARTPARRSTR
jgi:hypothetical protein